MVVSAASFDGVIKLDVIGISLAIIFQQEIIEMLIVSHKNKIKLDIVRAAELLIDPNSMHKNIECSKLLPL